MTSFRIRACYGAAIVMVAGGCSSDPVLPSLTPPPPSTSVADYRFLRKLGSSYTLEYRTIRTTAAGDSTVVGKRYRYTVIDTAAAIPGGKTAIAVLRETIERSGDVTETDTVFQWSNGQQLVIYEHRNDTVGRRRLAAPVTRGTTFILNDRNGTTDANTYRIVNTDTTLTTPVGQFRAISVRMESVTDLGNERTWFSDQQWLVPGVGILYQRQTARRVPQTSDAVAEEHYDFVLVDKRF